MEKLPQEFVDYTSKLFGHEGWQKFLSAFEVSTPVSVRVNPFKRVIFEGVQGVQGVQEVQDNTLYSQLSTLDSKLSTLDSRLSTLNSRLSTIPWCRDAYWLAERPDFTLDPLLHAGCYYVQEAGSMFLGHVLDYLTNNPQEAELDYNLRESLEDAPVLDLCAAPGGKSTLLRAMIPDSAWLISNEPDHRRANILMENLQKQGHPRVTVTNGYAKDFRRAKMRFPLIVADVPCSGEGMFRKDEGAIKEWAMQNVIKCAELQRSIIEDIWPCLEPGGILVYSTCTFNTREDEENVRWICDELGAQPISIPTLPEWNIQGSLLEGFNGPVYRFIPGITRSEGLFMAVLRKDGDMEIRRARRQDATLYNNIKGLHILHNGIPGGTQKGKDYIPDHALALSIDTDATAKYPRQELSREDSLRYLHREAITLQPDCPRGYIIVTYQSQALGFVKNIGTRANNLYPKEWAIRKKI